MDKNNCKLKISCNCIMDNTVPYQLNTHLLTAQETPELHKRANLSENGGYGDERSGEWAKCSYSMLQKHFK